MAPGPKPSRAQFAMNAKRGERLRPILLFVNACPLADNAQWVTETSDQIMRVKITLPGGK